MLEQMKIWLVSKFGNKKSINRRLSSQVTTEGEAIADYKAMLLNREYKIAELEGEIACLKIAKAIGEVRIEAYEAQQSNAILIDIQQLFMNQTKKGIRKYGETVRAENLTPVEWCQHALEEHADSMVYLMALKKSLEESETNGLETS
ncbi:hypothetical protein [Lysinibacillus sp. NPDC093216]|uniref:hypothetical protein n=1 Tax=Lysinibacillus sp. NPDC093216 TaxID=3390576 RepID=UPI003D00C7CC